MKINQAIDAIREELAKPLPEHQPTKEKKVTTKKVKKAKAAPTISDVVTLPQLAKEAKISGQKARQKLREAKIHRQRGTRWSWPKDSKDLKAVRKALGL